MKCWTRYVLPWIIALCVYLGSSFCSLAAEETDAVQGVTSEGLGYEACFLTCKDEIQAVIDGRGFNFDDMYYYGYYDAALDQIVVYLSSTKLVCSSYTDSSFVASVTYKTIYTCIVTTECNLVSCSYRYYSMNSNASYALNATSFSSYDIYDSAGDLFFRGPSPFRQAVQGLNWVTVMTETLMILPLLIVSLTFLLGLRKALRLVSSLLHRA